MGRAITKPTVESLSERLDQLERTVAFAFLHVKGVAARYGWSRSTFYRKSASLPRRTRWGWRLRDLVKMEADGLLPSPADGH